eukprot:Amastigsp_a677679_16.p3 type:complete len:100 gc:universal Amastigsp_a677679_16:691-392(-)
MAMLLLASSSSSLAVPHVVRGAQPAKLARAWFGCDRPWTRRTLRGRTRVHPRTQKLGRASRTCRRLSQTARSRLRPLRTPAKAHGCSLRPPHLLQRRSC